MQTATVLDFRSPNAGATDDPCRDDILGRMPALPRPRQRWTVRRKAAVIEAVRGGWVPIEEICRLYNLSVDEFLAWERDIDPRDPRARLFEICHFCPRALTDIDTC
jgi:hypothetical protein